MHVRPAILLTAVIFAAVACNQRSAAPAAEQACPGEAKSITLQAANLTFLPKVGPAALNGKKPVRVATLSGEPDMKLNLACKAVSTEDTKIHANCRVRGKTTDGSAKINSAPVQVDLIAGTPLQWGAAAELPIQLTVTGKDCGKADAEE
jgi:hypothetical protein